MKPLSKIDREYSELSNACGLCEIANFSACEGTDCPCKKGIEAGDAGNFSACEGDDCPAKPKITAERIFGLFNTAADIGTKAVAIHTALADPSAAARTAEQNAIAQAEAAKAQTELAKIETARLEAQNKKDDQQTTIIVIVVIAIVILGGIAMSVFGGKKE